MPEYPDYYDPDKILGHKGAAGEALRIKPYDFKRPDKFSVFQIRTISLVHETLSRKITDRLNSILEVKPEISVSLVDQVNFQEFMDLVNPLSLFAVYRFHESSGTFLLQCDPQGNNVLLESFAGAAYPKSENDGMERPDTAENGRSLTELESHILSPLYDSLAVDLGSAWWFFDENHIRLEEMETDAQFARIIPPNEMVVYAELEISTSLGNWKIRCVYPYITLEPRLEQLSFSYWYTRIRPGGSSLGRDRISRLPVQAGVELLLEPVTLSELERLKPGDSLEIPIEAKEQCRIQANGRDVEICSVASLLGERLEIAPVFPDDAGSEQDRQLLAMIRREIREGLEHRIPQLQEMTEAGVVRGSGKQSGENEDTSLQKPGDRAAMKHWVQSSRGLQNGSMMDREDYFEESRGIIQTLTVNKGAFLHQLMSLERESIQAALLMHLGHALGADYLARCEPGLREQIVRRLSTCRSQPDFFHAALNGYIGSKLEDYRNPVDMNCNGIEKTVEILNYSPRTVEMELITDLESSDPDLAEEIKRRMFVFEDLVILDPAALGKLLSQADPGDLALAVKRIPEELAAHLRNVMGEAEFTSLKETSDGLGAVRVQDVDGARMRIIQVLKELEEAGEVLVGRQGEMID